MNRKGESERIVSENVIYLILLVIFTAVMFYFLLQQQGGAVVWEDYYAKELVKTIDFAKSGDEICLDVHKATEIAKKNKVQSFSEIFMINNVNNEVCIKLSRGRQTCINYFNEVDIINAELKLAEGKNEDEIDVNVFCFSVMESAREMA